MCPHINHKKIQLGLKSLLWGTGRGRRSPNNSWQRFHCVGYSIVVGNIWDLSAMEMDIIIHSQFKLLCSWLRSAVNVTPCVNTITWPDSKMRECLSFWCVLDIEQVSPVSIHRYCLLSPSSAQCQVIDKGPTSSTLECVRLRTFLPNSDAQTWRHQTLTLLPIISGKTLGHNLI